MEARGCITSFRRKYPQMIQFTKEDNLEIPNPLEAYNFIELSHLNCNTSWSIKMGFIKLTDSTRNFHADEVNTVCNTCWNFWCSSNNPEEARWLYMLNRQILKNVKMRSHNITCITGDYCQARREITEDKDSLNCTTSTVEEKKTLWLFHGDTREETWGEQTA